MAALKRDNSRRALRKSLLACFPSVHSCRPNPSRSRQAAGAKWPPPVRNANPGSSVRNASRTGQTFFISCGCGTSIRIASNPRSAPVTLSAFAKADASLARSTWGRNSISGTLGAILRTSAARFAHDSATPSNPPSGPGRGAATATDGSSLIFSARSRCRLVRSRFEAYTTSARFTPIGAAMPHQASKPPPSTPIRQREVPAGGAATSKDPTRGSRTAGARSAQGDSARAQQPSNARTMTPAGRNTPLILRFP